MGLSLIEVLKIIFLGIVEGVTEWLPISSTGHMLLVDEIINFTTKSATPTPGLMIFVLIVTKFQNKLVF